MGIRKEVRQQTRRGGNMHLQGFNWECSHRKDPAWYSVLASRAHEMKAAGITAVWLPPPSASVSTEVHISPLVQDSLLWIISNLRQC